MLHWNPTKQSAPRPMFSMSRTRRTSTRPPELVGRASGEAGEVALANLNTPAQIVISGEVAALQRAIELAKAEGARRVAMLRVSIASHSPLMSRASQGLSEALAHVHLRDPEIPVIANISGQALHTAEEIRRELIENVIRPVNWTRSVRNR